jgi:hypothetical protein
MGLAVVTRIPSLVEAQIAAGALRSAGIDAQVFDGAFGQIEAPVIEALGGFRIMAPEEEAATAREILKELRASPGLGEPDENGPWAQSLPTSGGWRVKGLRLMLLAGAALAAAFWLLRVLTGPG